MISSITIDEAARTTWDAVVIGAGPAGALAAHQASRDGLATLLVECKRFPRAKTCGGCLNQRALEVVSSCGLRGVVDACGALPINELCLFVGGQATRFSLPAGLAVCRATFDSGLVRAAVDAGASFLPETQAMVDPLTSADYRCVSALRAGRRVTLRTRVVICADGLSRSSLKRLPEFASCVASGSRIGVGTTLAADDAPCGPRQIVMLVTPQGYVGLTRLAGDRLNVAAALDPGALGSRPLAETIHTLIRAAGVPVPRGLSGARWHGTPPLTNWPSRVADERLFLIGDASGYVEPFTGEGMSAALEGARAVAPVVAKACAYWNPSLAESWEATHRRIVYKKQTTCRALAWVLRRPTAVATALAVCRTFPRAAQLVISQVNRAPKTFGPAR